jgi:hypothetical protein
MQNLKIILIGFLIIVEEFSIVAQDISYHDFKVGIIAGYGLYQQSDLKKINENVKSQLNFETELINNFPPTFFGGIHFLYKLNPWIYIGLNYQFHTTGSRLGFKDYSGSYTFDQILSCHSPAIQIEGKLPNENKVSSLLSVLCGINIASWKINEDIIVGTQNESSTTRLSAIRPFIYPSVKFGYPVRDFISISLSAGYSIDLGGKYKLKSPERTVSDFTAEWTGPRVEFGVDYSF